MNEPDYATIDSDSSHPATVEIRRIDPVQCGKVLALLYILPSLLFVPFVLLGGIGGALAQPNGPGAAGGAFFAVFALLIPVIYGAMGFLFGIVGAWVYNNLVVAWVGGLEVDLG